MKRKRKKREWKPLSKEQAAAMITGFHALPEDADLRGYFSQDFPNAAFIWEQEFEGDLIDYAFDFNPDNRAIMARRHSDNYIEMIPFVALHVLDPNLSRLYLETEAEQRKNKRKQRYERS